MNVLVDTSIWSLAFRRQPVQSEASQARNQVYVAELKELIDETRAKIMGPIRQEMLSGISNPAQFQQLRDYLQAFEDLAIQSGDYERAAELFNLCRSKGIQGTHTDFLICAVAERYRMPVFTTDKDFALYARHIPLALYQPRTQPGSLAG